jgi:hypothetical protein
MAPKTHPNDDPTQTDTATQPQDSTSVTTDSAPLAEEEEAAASPS